MKYKFSLYNDSKFKYFLLYSKMIGVNILLGLNIYNKKIKSIFF